MYTKNEYMSLSVAEIQQSLRWKKTPNLFKHSYEAAQTRQGQAQYLTESTEELSGDRRSQPVSEFG